MAVNLPRKTAVDILLNIEKDGSYSNISLKETFSQIQLSSRDKAFVSALVYGVLDRKISIDYLISKYIKTTVSKIKPITRMALRIAVYQIKFMDKVPASAAVNESVNIVKTSKEKFNASFTNGVLRAYLRNPIELPDGDDVVSLKFRYSCPEWIIKGFIRDYGLDTAKKLLEESLKHPPVVIKVNTVKTDVETLISSLKSEGITAAECEVKNSLILNGAVDISNSKAYNDGLFYAEDIASQILISDIGINEGDRILDTCAAPGGKSFGMAMLCGKTGKVVSLDLYEHRVNLIKKNANRLNLNNISSYTTDASLYNDKLGEFDVVLCDVPCSGLGVIRRKPEIKYKEITEADFELLLKTQKEILEVSSRYVKCGGTLVYSTCTLNNDENRMQVMTFLDKHPDYELQYMNELMPHINNSDGFFYAKLKKQVII